MSHLSGEAGFGERESAGSKGAGVDSKMQLRERLDSVLSRLTVEKRKTSQLKHYKASKMPGEGRGPALAKEYLIESFSALLVHVIPVPGPFPPCGPEKLVEMSNLLESMPEEETWSGIAFPYVI